MTVSPGDIIRSVAAITDDLVAGVQQLRFAPPVTHVYNPLTYARSGFDQYVCKYGNRPKRVIFVGMNPGPFGMAQTGVPFGDVDMVTRYLDIAAPIGDPLKTHPKRPIAGFACTRGEVSGRRLWGWAQHRFGPPTAFFQHFFVLNYCPLVFMEVSGRNRTPDKLQKMERHALFAECDRALRRSVDVYQPGWVVGIGAFAHQRAAVALKGMDVEFGRITHPSPANPKANQGWQQRVEAELAAMGIAVPA